MTYPPLAHLPRSITRQRSLQKGNSASVFLTIFLQIGQWSLRERFRGMAELYAAGEICRVGYTGMIFATRS
jgi:hypothetical protein